MDKEKEDSGEVMVQTLFWGGGILRNVRRAEGFCARRVNTTLLGVLQDGLDSWIHLGRQLRREQSMKGTTTTTV